MERHLVPAVSPFADAVGYSRAVRDGRHVYVAGTAPVGGESDRTRTTRRGAASRSSSPRCASSAPGPSTSSARAIYVTDAADWEAIGRAHGEVFGDVRPASTMVVVAGLLDPRWQVEIEADAVCRTRALSSCKARE